MSKEIKKLKKLKWTLFSYFKYHNFNNSLLSFKYASNFKVTYTLPKHKKKDESSIYRYSHISPILPTFFKIYEWCAYGQIYKYFDQIFSSKCEYSFPHNYSKQNYLLTVVKKWKGRCLDKVVDCIKHDLFIAKLATCGSESLSLKFVFSNLVKENKEKKYKTLTIITLI